VGSAQIRRSTVDHWAFVFAGGRAPRLLAPIRRAQVRREALEFLISTRWDLLEAQRRSIALRVRPRQGSKTREHGQPTGRDSADVALEAQAAAALSALEREFGAERPVTPAMIAGFYAGHRAQFVDPERRAVLFTNGKTPQAAALIRASIAASRRFPANAKHLLLTRTSTTVGTSHDPNALDRAFYGSPPGRVMTVKQNRDYNVIEVERVFPASRQPLVAVEGTIRAGLASAERKQAAASLTRTLSATWRPLTECRRGYVVRLCGSVAAASSL
jgi:hypothetical protein